MLVQIFLRNFKKSRQHCSKTIQHFLDYLLELIQGLGYGRKIEKSSNHSFSTVFQNFFL